MYIATEKVLQNYLEIVLYTWCIIIYVFSQFLISKNIYPKKPTKNIKFEEPVKSMTDIIMTKSY